MDSLVTNALARGGACPNSVSRAATLQHVNFSAGSEIGECGCVGRYFLARLPPKVRS